MDKNIIASASGWVLTTIVEDYTGIAELSFNGKFISSSQDTFALIKKCPLNIAKVLRKQLVILELQIRGGANSVQNDINNLQLKYGSYVLNFYDIETIEAFKEMGVYLIPEG